MGCDRFAKEKEVFWRNHEQWLVDHEGKFVLIRGEEVDFFSSYADAFKHGLQKYAQEHFFIKEITESAPVSFIVAVKH